MGEENIDELKETVIRFTGDQYETMKAILKQVCSEPESLGLSQSEVDEVYSAVFGEVG